jgi:hypothetical protein
LDGVKKRMGGSGHASSALRLRSVLLIATASADAPLSGTRAKICAWRKSGDKIPAGRPQVK